MHSLSAARRMSFSNSVEGGAFLSDDDAEIE
jgi:hypothetical protein